MMRFFKNTTILAVALVLLMSLSLFSCGGSDTGNTTENTGSSQSEGSAEGAIEGWPSDNSIAKNIPVCDAGSVMDVTEEKSSVFIMINDVSRDGALDYWSQAQVAGYTDITSQSDTGSTGGFTYVANGSNSISISVTWSPGSGAGTLSILAIQF